jgi:hypothetical protein
MQGVASSDVIKDQHGIIYTGQEPEPYEDELPSEEESSMLPSVQVQNVFPEDCMHRCARINYAEVFTVEHDVKVYEVGDIQPSHLAVLRDNFRTVWDFEREQPIGGFSKAGIASSCYIAELGVAVVSDLLDLHSKVV